MEDTHITDPDKIERLLFVIAIAFCWAYRVGDIESAEKAIPVKTHGRPEKSLFRKGLDKLRHAIFRKIPQWEFRRLLKVFTSSEKVIYAL